jgi:ribonuclease HII
MKPDLTEEYALQTAGYVHIAGVDEAGRGAWAGPVCAAAVALPLSNRDLLHLLDGVRDSKLLSPRRREALAPVIQDVAEAVGVGWAAPAEVDAVGVLPATRCAMVRAIAALGTPPHPAHASGSADVRIDALLLDYVRLPEINLPQRAFPKADGRSLSVAAASIVAKVARDRVMTALEIEFPGYGFAAHKGYGTAQHRDALARLGATPIHRMSWRPLRDLAEAECN